ncbi:MULTISPECIES: PucR family transcriptional regulator [Brevibacterium]|uniref:PucR family transcriptional regulator n=1 Tax=Brevibacterium salitolerans TaxID=1403566 RepID=A0ABN2WKT7_9MICO|nr:helix-turn-helix domain-containing protein [Brevibacterium sp.]
MTVTIAQIAERLKDSQETIANEAADRLFTELASYAAVPRALILESARTNVSRGVDTLISRSAPTRAQVGEDRDTTRDRIERGVPIQDIIRAYRICLSVTHARFLSLAQEHGLPAEETLTGSTLLWEVGDWFVAGAAAEYRDHAGAEAVQHSLARGSLVTDLLQDRADEPHVLHRAVGFGIDPEHSYSVLIAGPPPERPARFLAELERACRGPHAAALLAQVGERIIGLAAQPPALRVSTPVAVGTPAPLTELSSSAGIAERIWRFVRTREPGVHTLSTCSWRLAVAEEPEIGDHLVQSLLTPLRPRTATGAELLSTLRTLLAVGMNVRLAAEELLVHENTVRYRLQRCRERTGRRLETLPELFELAWALEAWDTDAATPHGTGAASPD